MSDIDYEVAHGIACAEISKLRDELAAAKGRVHAAELHAAGMHTQRDEAIRDRDALRAELAAAIREGGKDDVR